MTRRRVPTLLCFCAVSASLAAHGASFGEPAISAVMGHPLQLVLPLGLDGDEGADCVKAEVLSGERSLPADEVRVQLTRDAAGAGRPGRWLARISTTSPIEEPVLQIRVTAGCSSRFTRQITALADPPQAQPALGMAAPLPALPGPAGDASRPARSPAPAFAARSAGPAASSPAAPRIPRERREKAAPGGARRSAAPQGAQLRLDMAASGPVLKMDMDEPLFMATGPLADGRGKGQGKEAPPPAGQAASIAMLERSQQALMRDNQGLRARAESAEQRAAWLPWLAGLLLLSAGAAGLLWRRNRAAERLSRAWWSPSLAAEAAAAPIPAAPAGPAEAVVSGVGSAAAPDARREAAGLSPGIDWSIDLDLEHLDPPALERDGGEVDLPLEPLRQPPTLPGAWAAAASAAEDEGPGAGRVQPARTTPFPPLKPLMPLAGGAEPTAREVSVEELLDLEQQADFFIALGQEEAAVDLLMSYLRSTGGQSPVPYTKLLEIYRRQGDRSAYERIRARFNRRFNAYAPDWDMGPGFGRVLEDFPYAVQDLERVWFSPLDAMATLEGMLFRKDESQDLFDLPAYKDVLMLYAVARDLWQQQGGSTDEVDLLLPLGADASIAGQVSGGPAPELAPGSGLEVETDAADTGADTGPLTRFDFSPSLLPWEQPPGKPGQR